MLTYDPTELRLQLLRNGYLPIPSIDKKCKLGGWASRAFVESINSETIPTWRQTRRAYKATGVLVRAPLMPLDFDIQDEAVMAHMMATLKDIAPEVYDYGPRRIGSPPKLMVFARWIKSEKWPDPFTREVTSKFKDADGKSHMIEVFGGRPSRSGGSSKQVGVYGPHSYFEDENENIIKPWKVKRLYTWEDVDGAPTLLNTPLAELPAMTMDQVWQLLNEFDRFAKLQPGWEMVVDKSKTTSTFVFDITNAKRFDILNGDQGVPYSALDEGMRVSGSFIDGSKNRPDKCLVGWCFKHQAIGVWDNENYAWHLPEELKPAGSNEELMERLKALLDDAPPAPPSGPRRPLQPKAEAPIEEKVKWLYDTQAYSSIDYTVIDIFEPSDRCQLAPKAFQMLYRPWRDIARGPQGGKVVVSATGAWEIFPARKNVDGVRMRPDQDFPLYEENGKFYKNTYLRPVHVNAGGDIKPFLAFLERFLPDPFERTWLLDWMAHKLRRPDIPGTAVVFVADDAEDIENGKFGTGRGMLFRMATKLFGEQYTRAQSFGIVSGTSSQATYNDWIQGSVLVMVDEAKTASTTGHRRAERNSVYEILKDTVDPAPKRMRVNPKGRQAYDSVSFASFWIATNHRNAMAIPRDDRRFTVLRNGRPMTMEQRAEMETWLINDANIGALAVSLAERDLDGFDMFVPLDTAGKAEMADMALSDVDELMIEMMADPNLGLVFTKQQMETKVQQHLGMNGVRWHGEFAAAWPTYCAGVKTEKGSPRRVRMGHTQKKLYCFRGNLTKARAAPEAALARQAAKWGAVDPIVGLYEIDGSQQKNE